MSWKRRAWFVFAALILAPVLALAVASPAEAFTSNCSDYAGLTNHIAGCVRTALDSATNRFYDPNGFYALMSKAVAGITILAVVIFGVMTSFGMLEKPGRDSIMLLVKIAAVSFFVTNSDMMYHSIIDMMDATADSVVSYAPSNGQADNSGKDFAQLTCMQKMLATKPAQLKGAVGPWLAMDCLIDSVIGIKVDPKQGMHLSTLHQLQKPYNDKLKTNDQGLSRGLLYLFFSVLHTSVLGILLAIIGFIFIWQLINMIVKALFVYLAGYIGIAALLILTPIFVPLVFFQVTKGYFDKWIKLLLSFALQPIIILVFIIFSISAVDLAVFSGDYSIMYRIAGNASRSGTFSLNEYLTTPRPNVQNPNIQTPVVQKTTLEIGQIKSDLKYGPAVVETQINSIAPGLSNSECTKERIDADNKAGGQKKLEKICKQNYAVNVYKNSLDWEQLASIRNPPVQMEGDATTPGAQISREVIAAAIFAAIVVFIMNQLLKVVPMVAYDLLGDFSQSPNLAGAVGRMPGADKLKGQLQAMVGGRGSS